MTCYPETTREKWRMAELSLVLLANVAGGTVLLAHELSGGGLMWQMLSTPIFVSYLYMSSYILPPSRDTQEKEREKAKKAKVPYARAPRRGAGPGLCVVLHVYIYIHTHTHRHTHTHIHIYIHT